MQGFSVRLITGALIVPFGDGVCVQIHFLVKIRPFGTSSNRRRTADGLGVRMRLTTRPYLRRCSFEGAVCGSDASAVTCFPSGQRISSANAIAILIYLEFAAQHREGIF